MGKLSVLMPKSFHSPDGVQKPDKHTEATKAAELA